MLYKREIEILYVTAVLALLCKSKEQEKKQSTRNKNVLVVKLKQKIV
jgi:hypothetical protein